MPVLVHLSAVLFSPIFAFVSAFALSPLMSWVASLFIHGLGFSAVQSLGELPGWCYHSVWLPRWAFTTCGCPSAPSSPMDALLGLRCGEEPRRAYDAFGFLAEQLTLGDALLGHRRSEGPLLSRRIPWDILSRSHLKPSCGPSWSLGAVLKPNWIYGAWEGSSGDRDVGNLAGDQQRRWIPPPWSQHTSISRLEPF